MECLGIRRGPSSRRCTALGPPGLHLVMRKPRQRQRSDLPERAGGRGWDCGLLLGERCERFSGRSISPARGRILRDVSARGAAGAGQGRGHHERRAGASRSGQSRRVELRRSRRHRVLRILLRAIDPAQPHEGGNCLWLSLIAGILPSASPFATSAPARSSQCQAPMDTNDRNFSQGATIIPLAQPEAGQAGQNSAKPPRLLDRVRAGLRARHYSPHTEKTYVAWIRRFILFHGKRHPETMSEADIGGFSLTLPARPRSAPGPRTKHWPRCCSCFRRCSVGDSSGWATWCTPSGRCTSRSCWDGTRCAACWPMSKVRSGWSARSCMAVAYACLKRCNSASPTLTLVAARSSSAKAKVKWIAERSYPASLSSGCVRP